MELPTLFLIIFLIGLFLFYNSKSFSIENLTENKNLTFKKQDYNRYRSLIFGEIPKFT